MLKMISIRLCCLLWEVAALVLELAVLDWLSLLRRLLLGGGLDSAGLSSRGLGGSLGHYKKVVSQKAMAKCLRRECKVGAYQQEQFPQWLPQPAQR